MEKIPKILHLYWDGSPLSYLNYLTVPSFLQHHTGYKIKVWTPDKQNTNITWITNEQKIKYIGNDFFYLLSTHPEVEVLTMDFSQLELDENMSEVHKSDYFRLYILSTEGGIWSDFDIIYVANIEEVFNNIKVPRDFETLFCEVHSFMSYYPVGFLMASSNNAVYKYVLNIAKKRYDPDNYQAIGSHLLEFIGQERLLSFPKCKTVFVTGHVYLPLECVHLHYLFNEDVTSKINHLIGKSIFGFHWFNGSDEAKIYINSFDFQIRFNDTVSVLAKRVIRWLRQKYPQVQEHFVYNIE